MRMKIFVVIWMSLMLLVAWDLMATISQLAADYRTNAKICSSTNEQAVHDKAIAEMLIDGWKPPTPTIRR